MQLKANSKLYYIEYLDHGIASEPIENIRKKPFKLWSCGYILNENCDDDIFYALVSTGTRDRPQKPIKIEYIIKPTIIKKILIHTINDD